MQSSEMRTPYRLRVLDYADIGRAQSALAGGFVWDSTPQGHAFWQKVYNALEDIEVQAKMILADEQPCLPAL
jgi:hypothetical protein